MAPTRPTTWTAKTGTRTRDPAAREATTEFADPPAPGRQEPEEDAERGQSSFGRAASDQMVPSGLVGARWIAGLVGLVRALGLVVPLALVGTLGLVRGLDRRLRTDRHCRTLERAAVHDARRPIAVRGRKLDHQVGDRVVSGRRAQIDTIVVRRQPLSKIERRRGTLVVEGHEGSSRIAADADHGSLPGEAEPGGKEELVDRPARGTRPGPSRRAPRTRADRQLSLSTSNTVVPAARDLARPGRAAAQVSGSGLMVACSRVEQRLERRLVEAQPSLRGAQPLARGLEPLGQCRDLLGVDGVSLDPGCACVSRSRRRSRSASPLLTQATKRFALRRPDRHRHRPSRSAPAASGRLPPRPHRGSAPPARRGAPRPGPRYSARRVSIAATCATSAVSSASIAAMSDALSRGWLDRRQKESRSAIAAWS